MTCDVHGLGASLGAAALLCVSFGCNEGVVRVSLHDLSRITFPRTKMLLMFMSRVQDVQLRLCVFVLLVCSLFPLQVLLRAIIVQVCGIGVFLFAVASCGGLRVSFHIGSGVLG